MDGLIPDFAKLGLVGLVIAMRCTWCNTDSEEAAARHEGPHAKWCVHWRDPGLPEGMTVDVVLGRKVHHYKPPPGAPLVGINATMILTDELGLADALTLDQQRSDQERRDWAGDYDGTECPNCKRVRMLLCTNGKRRCEKCNWDPDAGRYSDGPHIG